MGYKMKAEIQPPLTGPCGRCGAPGAPYVGCGPIGGVLDGDDFFCDDCNEEMMQTVFMRTEEE
jgi:hypothetical protein